MEEKRKKLANKSRSELEARLAKRRKVWHLACFFASDSMGVDWKRTVKLKKPNFKLSVKIINETFMNNN